MHTRMWIAIGACCSLTLLTGCGAAGQVAAKTAGEAAVPAAKAVVVRFAEVGAAKFAALFGGKSVGEVAVGLLDRDLPAAAEGAMSSLRHVFHDLPGLAPAGSAQVGKNSRIPEDLAEAALRDENPLKVVEADVAHSNVASEFGLSPLTHDGLRAVALPLKQQKVDPYVDEITNVVKSDSKEFGWSLACTTGTTVLFQDRLPTQQELEDFVASKAQERGLKAVGVRERALLARTLLNMSTDLASAKKSGIEVTEEVVELTCEEVHR